jgi:poly-gamma-glutamate synthase PgsB/CapB
MILLLVLVLLFVTYGIIEYWLHCHRLRRIPIRIQVNGTRGKSSVTRLIAAGLRASGSRVIAKTTGATPRFIISNTEEIPIKRLGKPNIIENVRIIRRALKYKPDAVVLECMALVPEFQWTDAHRVIRPTHGVITNARADHLDVMGPTVTDVAVALANTVPDNALFFSAEQERFPVFARQAERNHTRAFQAHAETVTGEEMKGFTYIEHKENVALALQVCESLQVERKAALRSMQQSLPDPGALRIYTIPVAGKRMEFVNTLAANDPDSILILWEMMKGRKSERIVLVNCRADRTDRSRQLAELCAERFDADYYLATGSLTAVFVRTALNKGLPANKVVDLGDELPPAAVFSAVGKLIEGDALIFATGNIVGYGDSLVQYFAGQGGEIAY